MANVTDSASVLVVPSGWSDGVLGSLQPDDGTGDFTFSRGSDLSATRVNEQGLIEKGYENLLLQSNTFDTTWIRTNSNITSGEQGYDGSNDAWLLTGLVGSHALTQNISNSGVATYSLYAKAGTGSGIRIRASGSTTYTMFVTLTDGTIFNNDGIDGKVIDAGNGWYKYEFTFSTSLTSIQMRITNGTTGDFAGTIYIQDAQLNQGLVAYPYIETGITTAKNAVILEDQPRINYTSGNGAVLIEPQRTNLIPHSESFESANYIPSLITITDNATTSPEGVLNASKLTMPSGNALKRLRLTGLPTNSVAKSLSLFAKSDDVPAIQFATADSQGYAYFDIANGVVGSTGTKTTAKIEDYGNGWYRCIANFDSTNTFNNSIYIYPSDSATGTAGGNTSAEGDLFVYGAQYEEATYSGSYIPTYGTSQTRLKDTATLTKNVTSTGTIYININAQTSRTLTFLGADISVTEGVNKIAMAYSPTALKVSKNGTIVANITRAFDTTALTQIQLGHRNNFEQTTDSINQFLTLDSFLNDTQLNELTA